MSIVPLGILAAVCTTLAFLPQVVKTIKTRQTQDLSLVMLSLQGFGNICWGLYGYMLAELPIVIANIITFHLVLVIWLLKVFHKKPLVESGHQAKPASFEI